MFCHQVGRWFVDKAYRVDQVTGSTTLTSSIIKAGLKLLQDESDMLSHLQTTIKEFSAAVAGGESHMLTVWRSLLMEICSNWYQTLSISSSSQSTSPILNAFADRNTLLAELLHQLLHWIAEGKVLMHGTQINALWNLHLPESKWPKVLIDWFNLDMCEISKSIRFCNLAKILFRALVCKASHVYD